MTTFREQIHLLAVDRHTPETRALLETLLQYVASRVKRVVHTHASDLFGESKTEELVGDIFLQLLSGSLTNFRGDSLPELLAFVRTVSDRCVWKAIRRAIRDRETLEHAENVYPRDTWQTNPEKLIALVPDNPLSDADANYLKGLIEAGSKAEYARKASLSRAAVTQRVKRIRQRIEGLNEPEQLEVEAWLRHTARSALCND